MNQLIKPNKLNPKDKIAAVTLSWGGPGAFPYRYEVGKQRLESIFGLEVAPTKHALKDPDWIYRNPRCGLKISWKPFLIPALKKFFQVSEAMIRSGYFPTSTMTETYPYHIRNATESDAEGIAFVHVNS